MKDRWTLPLFPDEALTVDPPRAHPAELICDDVLHWAETYKGPKFHALLCDPPYHLTEKGGFTSGAFGTPRSEADKSRRRADRTGFMGTDWDGSDISFRPETWAALAQHLLPGAFGLCFASSRGWHRLACAIEDAGLIIHPSIFGWGFGSGFPKATRIDAVLEKQRHDESAALQVTTFLDAAVKRAGLSRADLNAVIMGQRHHGGSAQEWMTTNMNGVVKPRVPTCDQWLQLKTFLHLSDEMDAEVWRLNGRKGQPGEIWHEREVIGKGRSGKTAIWTEAGTMGNFDLTAPATSLAQTWAGHRYGLQALKPALEPLIVWQVPYQGKPVQSITQTGAGALWIDGARLTTSEPLHGSTRRDDMRGGHYGSGHRPNPGDIPDYAQHASGRWPSNFAMVHTHAPDALCEANACPVAALDAQAGERSSHDTRDDGSLYEHMRPGSVYNIPGTMRQKRPPGRGDTGGASRFFKVADWSLDIAERLAQADPVRYEAKASRSERQQGLDCLERVVISWKSWENVDLKAQLLVDTAVLPPKVIDVSTTQSNDVTAWNTLLFGNGSMVPSLQATKSITAMITSSITASKTLSYLVHSLINATIVAVNGEEMNGGSHAETAVSSIPSLTIISESSLSLPGVGHVASQTPLKISGNDGPVANHPTVKPLKLTQWLATLLLPPDAYAPRRVLIPFAGVGSEGLGAMLAGWEEIVMIEQDQGYVNIARERLAYWARQRQGW
jgi:hypothetical protein